MTVTYEAFVQQLRDVREAAGLTQDQLARRLKISRGSIGLYETAERRPPLDLAGRWAEVCHHRMVITFVDERTPNLGPLTDDEQLLIRCVRALQAPGLRELVLRLARALPGHDVARESLIRQLDLLESLSASVGAQAGRSASRG